MNEPININIIPLENSYDIPIPLQKTSGSAGFDVFSANIEPIILEPHKWTAIPTGYIFEIPFGYEIQVRSRSGLSLKHGIAVLNSPGTIDSDYRGEVKIILINHSDQPFEIVRGMRIAQFIIAQIIIPQFTLTTEFSDTKRGSGGFGSTALHG
eukprot:TRINITY_DN11936_c0_g1_i1.p1 TRINITY_DN11936_c0_g1~~TRINITY_DN11936_c0_g1_i1.p1  ORF type:complete len:153 (+),score=39.88 TRINITY_DN11936_c0_g1_i1:155-613(+)